MNRFDKRYNQLVNEVLGSIAKNVATGLSSGLQAAKDPSAGMRSIFSNIENLRGKNEDLLKQSFSLKNQPKLNQIAVTTAPIYGVVDDPKTQKPKLITIMPNATVFGKITKAMDNQGNYGIALTDEKGNPSQKYVFAQTESAPYWQIYDKNKLPIEDISMEEPSDFVQDEDDDENVLAKDANNNPMVLMALLTGPAKDDVSEPLKMWRDYKTFLSQQKK